MTSEDRPSSTAARLRERIIAGSVRPGQQLFEHSLSDELAVSRNTLREAFRVLIYEGLLVRHANRGVFVAGVTEDMIRDVYRARKIVEPTSASVIAPEAVRVADVVAAVDRAEAAAARGEWAQVGTENMEFHYALVGLAGSPRVLEFFARLEAELRLVFLALDEPEAIHAEFIPFNREIAELVVKGEPGQAAERMRAYLELSERTMIEAFRR